MFVSNLLFMLPLSAPSLRRAGEKNRKKVAHNLSRAKIKEKKLRKEKVA